MPILWRLLLILALAFTASATCPGADLSDDFTSLDSKRWTLFGRYLIPPGRGIRLGPMEGMWAASGLRSNDPVGNPAKGVRTVVDLTQVNVSVPAPREGTNQAAPADVSVNVQLSAERDVLFFDAARPAMLVVLMINAEKDETAVGVRGKPSGRAKNYGENLVSVFLGPGLAKKKLRVVSMVKDTAATVSCTADGQSVWNWQGTLPEALGEKSYLTVYEQNILTGQGSAIVRAIEAGEFNEQK